MISEKVLRTLVRNCWDTTNSFEGLQNLMVYNEIKELAKDEKTSITDFRFGCLGIKPTAELSESHIFNIERLIAEKNIEGLKSFLKKRRMELNGELLKRNGVRGFRTGDLLVDDHYKSVLQIIQEVLRNDRSQRIEVRGEKVSLWSIVTALAEVDAADRMDTANKILLSDLNEEFLNFEVVKSEMDYFYRDTLYLNLDNPKENIIKLVKDAIIDFLEPTSYLAPSVTAKLNKFYNKYGSVQIACTMMTDEMIDMYNLLYSLSLCSGMSVREILLQNGFNFVDFKKTESDSVIVLPLFEIGVAVIPYCATNFEDVILLEKEDYKRLWEANVLKDIHYKEGKVSINGKRVAVKRIASINDDPIYYSLFGDLDFKNSPNRLIPSNFNSGVIFHQNESSKEEIDKTLKGC